ncbi:hypothetical protein U9M48_044360 [Paspalum notatum var. saurae]|uniref:BZIP domain-containing protein n=1 Tax=Paspalum notatum var. saurae TaxID=547442 RepID=A0AAQ3XI63_PASNO
MWASGLRMSGQNQALHWTGHQTIVHIIIPCSISSSCPSQAPTAAPPCWKGRGSLLPWIIVLHQPLRPYRCCWIGVGGDNRPASFSCLVLSPVATGRHLLRPRRRPSSPHPAAAAPLLSASGGDALPFVPGGALSPPLRLRLWRRSALSYTPLHLQIRRQRRPLHHPGRGGGGALRSSPATAAAPASPLRACEKAQAVPNRAVGLSLVTGTHQKNLGAKLFARCLVPVHDPGQAMASQAGGGSGSDAGSAQRGYMQDLARQGSLYNLTLDEVQNHLGEPLLSMNFDELLKSVFPDGGVDTDGAGTGKPDLTSNLQRQGSIVMPPQLSKKTVDEVWKGILDGPETSAAEGGWRRRERQRTLGEMTLEDFLVKAGVVTEGLMKDSDDLPSNMDSVRSSATSMAAGTSGLNPGEQWLQQYQQQALESQQPSLVGSYMASQLAPQPLSIATGAIMDSIYSDGQITLPTLGALSDPQTPGRKRAASGEVVDKVIERRQKRMIKNRESAARSRARKQAYTNELENKVSRLEEDNEMLKKQKELDEILSSAPPPQPKYQLRRISSAAF